MPTRNASAVWDGNFRRGQGRMRTGTGACEGDYTAGSRFEEAKGTNPEELIGAAHAGCFSMALALALDQAGYSAERIETQARVHIDKVDGGFRITRIELETHGKVPGASVEAFQAAAQAAKEGCPVSQALKGVEVGLQAHLQA